MKASPRGRSLTKLQQRIHRIPMERSFSDLCYPTKHFSTMIRFTQQLNLNASLLIKYTVSASSTCFEKVQTIPPSGYSLINVSYDAGAIVQGTLQITHIPQRPGSSRVTFDVSAPYKATFKNSSDSSITQDASLPGFPIDTIIYLPISRSETPFDIFIETRSSTLAIDSLQSTFAAGVIVVISVTSLVQLLIPCYGFCPDSCECEEYQPSENTVCSDFLNESKTPFPFYSNASAYY